MLFTFERALLNASSKGALRAFARALLPRLATLLFGLSAFMVVRLCWWLTCLLDIKIQMVV